MMTLTQVGRLQHRHRLRGQQDTERKLYNLNKSPLQLILFLFLSYLSVHSEQTCVR